MVAEWVTKGPLSANFVAMFKFAYVQKQGPPFLVESEVNLVDI